MIFWSVMPDCWHSATIIQTEGVIMKYLKAKIIIGMIVAVVVIIYILTAADKVLASCIVVAIAVVLFALYKFLKYMFSAYFKSTKESYFKVLFNKNSALRYNVFKKFNKKLNDSKMVVCDVYMPKVDGTVSKADMILLNETGIYVIDTKPYMGRIAGAEQGREWTYTRGGKTENIPNPMIWNKLYMNWLKSYLNKECPNVKLYSYVVYNAGCRIKDITFKNYIGIVATRTSLSKEIAISAARIGTSIAPSEMDLAYDKIKALKDAEFAKTVDEVQGIQETIFYERKKEFNEYDYKNPDLE